MKWWQTSFVLCCYGFFKEYRPSEPFITPYLTNFKNFTIEEINQKIYPLGTYFYLVLLVAIFLLTDLLRYKPILVVGGFSAIITWSLLLMGETIEIMQVVEFFYGLFMASEVAYFTYMYSKVDKTHYQKVTSHTRAAFLLGKASAGFSSQIFVYFNLLDYLKLNYVTLFGVCVATLSAFFLPPVQQSLYFHNSQNRKVRNDNNQGYDDFNDEENNKFMFSNHKCQLAFHSLWQDCKEAFCNTSVLRWSIWWAMATCGYLQVISYAQLLWENITLEDETLYHGYIECASSLLGAAVAFLMGYSRIPWNIWGEIFLGILTILQGCLLFYCAFLNKLLLAYLMHIFYLILYQAAITVSNYEVAKYIKDRSYALVFGVNTFFALLIQTVLTTIVINILKTSIIDQFKIYGGYHIAIGITFLVIGISIRFFKTKQKDQLHLEVT